MKLQMPTLECIHHAYDEGKEAVVELFSQVGVQFEQFAAQVAQQGEALQELQARLNKNSSNSGKPPSSDGYAKAKRTQSLRKSGQNPNGGQAGHKGHTLKVSPHPDHLEICTVAHCTHCGFSLNQVNSRDHEERQVFDIPSIRIEVTSYQAEIKCCPDCGKESRGEFPSTVNQPVQYGTGVSTWASYFSNQHFVSLQRTAQIFEDLLHHRISEASILKASQRLCEKILPATNTIQQQLRETQVAHVDETGMRVEGKLHWMHVCSSKALTSYSVHAKRGKEAMDEAEILPGFTGTLVHDHWKSYFRYKDCSHALCNAHHLRELQFIERQYGQVWAADLAHLLLNILKEVNEIRLYAKACSPEQIQKWKQNYDDILIQGYKVNPKPPPEKGTEPPKKKGRRKQTPPLNLLDRLRDYKPQVLAFMLDFQIPFSNNLGEQDVRMMKVKQKVSGSFRTREGAQTFAQIRGYISTARKNTVNIFEALSKAFEGTPFIPAPFTKSLENKRGASP